MTRTFRSVAGPSAHGISSLDRSRGVRKKKPYKVVMEVVTQEKKKLQSIKSYSANAPRGYTFVPLGNRDLTEYCKEKCRNRNLEVHIVSAKPKGKGRTPSEPRDDDARIDTSRIGHHFPNAIIDEACDILGYYFRNGLFQKNNRNYEETRLARSLHNHGQRMQLHGRPATEAQTREQTRSAILEVFPKIPEADLEAIVEHAFQEGTKRVGNATDLSLARRVQLAVGAYIRHQYTDYDKILKSGCSWPEARQRAQPLSYAKMKEWRDEADTSNELEETFREIIVLDDDEDDDSEESEDTTPSTGRAESLEIISSRATARQLQPESPTRFAQQDAVYANGRQGRRIILRSIPNLARPRIVQQSSRAPSPRGLVRVDARLPPHPVPAPPQVVRRLDPAFAYEHNPTLTSAQPHGQDFEMTRRPHANPPDPRLTASPTVKMIRDADGRLYNLIPVQDHADHDPRPGAPHLPPNRPNASDERRYSDFQRRVKAYGDSNAGLPPPPSRRPSMEDVVLPSVEREADFASPAHGRDPVRVPIQNQHPSSPMYYDGFGSGVSPAKRKALLPMNSSPKEYSNDAGFKRPRAVLSYDQRAPQDSTPRRLSDRPPIAQYNPPHDVVDLTHSPRHMSDRGRIVQMAPPRASAAAMPSGHPYTTDHGGHYDSAPGFGTANGRRSAPREVLDYVDARGRPIAVVPDQENHAFTGVRYSSQMFR